MKTGIILNNIGSPDAPDTASVRVYLQEFLMAVIEVPVILRFFLVYLIITPFRAPKSAEKYRKIWTDKGSPLVVITNQIAIKLRSLLPMAVETGMQFQNPSLTAAIASLIKQNDDLEKIYLVPMFPQYSEATTGASIAKFKKDFNAFKKTNSIAAEVELFVMKPFYDEDFFIDELVIKISEFDLENYDLLLFSYHGLPKASILKNSHCKMTDLCCETGMKHNCYRSQCYTTTKATVKKLNSKIKTMTTFQSRLGRSEWIQPYTDRTIEALAQSGTKRVLVICPAFTVDCLETLEEIKIENKEIFLKSGGQTFDYVPCLNDDTSWCQRLAAVIQEAKLFEGL